MKRLFFLILAFYQKFFSPDHGTVSIFFPYGYCRFHPSCSEYMKLACKKHGIIHGVLRGARRVARCNPWNKGGVDSI